MDRRALRTDELIAGPDILGRGLVIARGGSVNAPWEHAEQFVIDQTVLANPRPMADALHRCWLERQRVVIVLDVDADELRRRERDERPPHELDPTFEFSRERLQYLVWSNNVDGRGATRKWWHTDRAVRLGARPIGDGVGNDSDVGDVILSNVTPAWCDGGPPEPFAVDLGAVVPRDTIEAGRLTPLGHDASVDTTSLAPDQLAAVLHRRGPARIIAPAGSGKTRVLTERLRHLLADRHVDASNVTAIAFNRKAADEMIERTAGFPVRIRTINALGLAICNDAGLRRTVIDEREVRRRLDDLLPPRRRQNNVDAMAPYLEGLAAIRIGLMPPEIAEATHPDAKGLAELFGPWRQRLVDHHETDFDDQIYAAIEILLREPSIRKRWQAQCRHLLVDEFQDLAPAHMLLVRLLSAPTYNVFGVGDDDQTIYGHVGADPTHLIEYDEFFPGAASHALEVNYRSVPPIVDAAGKLLAYNRRRIAKRVRAARSLPDDGGLPASIDVRRVTAVDEAPMVTTLIESWLNDGVAADQIAVLARVNAALLASQLSLAVAGRATTTPLDGSILQRTGIRAALAWFRIALDPEQISAGDLSETLRRPSRKIAPNVTQMLTRSRHTSVSDIRRLASRLSGADVAKLEGYAIDVTTLATVARNGAPTARILQSIAANIGLATAIADLDASRGEADRSSHADDLDALLQVAALHSNAATFVDWLRQMLDRPAGRVGRVDADDPHTADGSGPLVTLSTVHRVKGREWDRVIVVGADQGLFPHRLASDVEEERRVFHVAITRARDVAVVIADNQDPSIFVAEMEGTAPPPSHTGHEAPTRSDHTTPSRATPSNADTASSSKKHRPKSEPVAVAAADAALVEALRAWRRERAKTDGVPPYVVMHDRHLVEIAARRPASLVELGRCAGMGAVRLDRYGPEILAVIVGG